MGSNEIDVVDNGAIVKVFLLEGAFPYKTPQDILDSAGSFWESFALTHAALGFLVEDSGSQHLVELYPSNYIGSFLPDVTPPPSPPTPAPSPAPTAPPFNTSAPTPAPTTLTPAPFSTPEPMPGPPSPTPSPEGGNATTAELRGGGFGAGWRREDEDLGYVEVQGVVGGDASEAVGAGVGAGWWRADGGDGTTPVAWKNDALLRVSVGFDEKRWLSANYVARITGLLYNDITGWANTYLEQHPTFQPLSACGRSDGKDGREVGEFGHNFSADSYDFVWAAFDRLAKNGVIFESEVVLKPKRTVMCLFPEGGVAAAEFVDAKGNEEIAEFFRDTGKCVRSLAAAAASGSSPYEGPACASNGGGADGWGGEGGVSVMLGLGNCLGGHENAFLYHNSSTYLRLPLNGTSGVAAEREVNSGTYGDGRVGGMAARLVRYAPQLPPRPVQPPGGPDRAYIVYLAIGLAVLGVVVASLRLLYRRTQAKLAYGRGTGGSQAGGGGLFSSSIGSGWKSGGRSGSDFGGDFDTSFAGSGGDEFEGNMFPGDSYGSGSRSQSWGRMSGWRSGGSGKPPASVRPLEVPLLNHSESPLTTGEGSGARPGAAAQAASMARPSSSRRARGRTSAAPESTYGRGAGDGGGSGASPPPFSRIVGIMGGGPAAPAGKKQAGGGRDRFSEGKSMGAGAGEEEDLSDDALDQRGPFGGDSGRRDKGSLKNGGLPEGDEVFC